MKTNAIPLWVRLSVALVIGVQAGVTVFLLTGRFEGPARNLVLQVWIGGLAVLLLLAAYVWRFHAEAIPPAPVRLGVGLLIVLALGLTALYAYSVRSLLRMPYDLASWSEPMMIVDIIRLRTGAQFYLAPEGSNSNVYTPGAPAVTYSLAWLFHRPTSIPFFRLLQQVYLVIAALFAAAATRDLLRLVEPQRFSRVPREWLMFFVLVFFLLATNPQTDTFNVYLHNDPLALLASTATFWLLMRHCATKNSRWLWALAVAPAVGFMVKQTLAVWAVALVAYLWLDGNYSFRRVLAFGLACFGILAAMLGVCLLVWGAAFRYWAFEAMGAQVVSPIWIANRYADAAGSILIGLLGGCVLPRGQNPQRLLGVWMSWVILLLAGLYSSGITYHPTHLGAAAMVAGCFALAALAILWPDPRSGTQSPASQWFRMGMGLLLVLTMFAELGLTHRSNWRVSPDLSRYAEQIEREFEGLPTERVLLDLGDWIYLRHGVLMKDRQPILTTHQKPYYGLLERIRHQEYAKILVHELSNGVYAYDLGANRGIRDAILAHYHEVRRIPQVRGMEDWLYTGLTMADIVVLEPNPHNETNVKAHLPQEMAVNDNGVVVAPARAPPNVKLRSRIGSSSVCWERPHLPG